MGGYTPTEDEKRVIAWLRKAGARWKLSSANEAKLAATSVIVTADAIERGDHRHD
jgi:hypothetical protein